jgi:hypothetical protein
MAFLNGIPVRLQPVPAPVEPARADSELVAAD